MRISLHAKSSVVHPPQTDGSLLVTIKPFSNCFFGSFEYRTESNALFQLLRRRTDLAGYTLELFARELTICKESRLSCVHLNDSVLDEIGYFVD